jgi:hypothetical protein
MDCTSLGAPSSPIQVMDLLLRELRRPPGPPAGLLPVAPREARSSGGMGREEDGPRLPSGSSGTAPRLRVGASSSMLLRLLGGCEPRRSIYMHQGRHICTTLLHHVLGHPGPSKVPRIKFTSGPPTEDARDRALLIVLPASERRLVSSCAGATAAYNADQIDTVKGLQGSKDFPGHKYPTAWHHSAAAGTCSSRSSSAARYGMTRRCWKRRRVEQVHRLAMAASACIHKLFAFTRSCRPLHRIVGRWVGQQLTAVRV